MMKKLLVLVLFCSATASAMWQTSTAVNEVVNRPGMLRVKASSAPNRISSINLTKAKYANFTGANPDDADMAKKVIKNRRKLHETQQSNTSWFQWLKGADDNKTASDRAIKHSRSYALDTECIGHILSQAENAQTPDELLAIVRSAEGDGVRKVIKHFRAAIRENGRDLEASIYYVNGNTTVEGLQDHLKRLNQFEEPLAKYYRAQMALSKATRHVLTKLLEQKTHEAQQIVADNRSNKTESKRKKRTVGVGGWFYNER